jgi:hypothetical protein
VEDGEAAKGDDERRNLEPLDGKALHKARQRTDSDRREQRREPALADAA